MNIERADLDHLTHSWNDSTGRIGGICRTMQDYAYALGFNRAMDKVDKLQSDYGTLNKWYHETLDRAEKAEKELAEMGELLKDIYRVCGASSKASHKEQTAIFRRLRESIGVSV